MQKRALYFCIMSILGLSTNSFGMRTEEEFNQHPTPNKPFSVQIENTPTNDLISYLRRWPKSEKLNYDKELASICGKNVSSFPLSEEMFYFIVSRVGSKNKRPFVFKIGPQIIFEDDIDLLR